MPSPTHGYSGKPLYKKLGLKAGFTCLTIRAPKHYSELVKGAEGVRFVARKTAADAVHIFCTRKSDLAPLFDRAVESAVDGGMIWVSWPKKSSPLYRDLSEQDLRDHILPTGWVDVKVCAVDSDWSGLQFRRRRN
ncbi:MAG: hypothetical protein ACE361_24010 [Aureliella sp.]